MHEARQSRMVHVRVTPSQDAHIAAAAETLEMSKSAYIRSMAMLPLRISNDRIGRDSPTETPVLVAYPWEVEQMLGELRRAGANYNQALRSLNILSSKDKVAREQVAAVLEGIAHAWEEYGELLKRHVCVMEAVARSMTTAGRRVSPTVIAAEIEGGEDAHADNEAI